MPSVTYNGVIIAQSDNTVFLEGNYYFPRESIKIDGFLQPSNTEYTCPWKGEATYYDGVVDGNTIKDVAWSYESPKPAAKQITNHLAFDKSKIKLTS